FPTALAWHAPSDTFFYLERNSGHFVRMRPDGEVVDVFPHPSRPFQNFVFNLGLAIAEDGESMWITGANDFDTDVTKAMEMTLDGALTGREIPLGELPFVPVGITLASGDLIAVGSQGLGGQFARVRMSDE